MPQVMTSPGFHSGILLLNGDNRVVNLFSAQEPSKLTDKYKLICPGKGLKECRKAQAHLDAPVISAFGILESDVPRFKVDVLPLQKSDLLPSGSGVGQAIDEGIDHSGTVSLCSR